jgi:hypothetical protein
MARKNQKKLKQEPPANLITPGSQLNRNNKKTYLKR